ncbi:xanthine dehydrogenase accessory protein XdhC [Jannaschia sp. W003]|uniref:xanthine dehydrogenase accessory protein XdhC n=1 Tax=Jannaschia sp. W003 TaxID=2867012 RepID=UPI0021A47745|nr:xanthine dehydrogenase accessory protein XdhC [Jannaschia sp. W003]UWQ22261.1 xanthine dehydrogenase accessory protein XdhC [Jannaschia sp. W003]
MNRAALEAALARGPVARVAVAETRGSVPREAGAEMRVWDGGFDGTIGGGALEWRALALARETLADGRTRVERMPLGPALAQCCGGAVTLVVERLKAMPPDPWLRRVEGDRPAPSAPFEGLRDGWMRETARVPARALWVWGAGHVGRALVAVVAPLPDLAVTWIDVAEDRFPDRIPEGVARLVAADPPRLMARAPEDAEHLVLTHSHEIDLALCHAALARGFRACGLIGSATKWARFRSRLRALGHGDDAIARIACPIGDPALGKHPQAIAVGVAAALLSRQSAAAAQPEGSAA